MKIRCPRWVTEKCKAILVESLRSRARDNKRRSITPLGMTGLRSSKVGQPNDNWRRRRKYVRAQTGNARKEIHAQSCIDQPNHATDKDHRGSARHSLDSSGRRKRVAEHWFCGSERTHGGIVYIALVLNDAASRSNGSALGATPHRCTSSTNKNSTQCSRKQRL